GIFGAARAPLRLAALDRRANGRGQIVLKTQVMRPLAAYSRPGERPGESALVTGQGRLYNGSTTVLRRFSQVTRSARALSPTCSWKDQARNGHHRHRPAHTPG